jgi:hypothetical protein
MPGKPSKQHRIRVRTLDGKARDKGSLGQLKSNQLRMNYLDIEATDVQSEFIICAINERQIEEVLPKLGGVGLALIEGGDTTIVSATQTPAAQQARQAGFQQRRGAHQRQDGIQQRPQPAMPAGPVSNAKPLPGKPYGFVALPKDLTSTAPIWHDGTSSVGRLAGEIRFEFTTLTPLLVGWERGQVGSIEGDWRVPENLAGTQLADHKSVLCPLRAPWGKRPVIIPGDSLKGLLRHELGALLGAPMERVAERTYSYRPNAMYPSSTDSRFLIPRLARVVKDHIDSVPLDNHHEVRVPTRLDLFPATLQYNKKERKFDYLFDQQGGGPYRGGQGAGQKLNSKPKVHGSLKVQREVQTERFPVPDSARHGYVATVRHLVSLEHGHFSERHPDVPQTVSGGDASSRILDAAKYEVFQPGDFVWVEWDTEKKCIVSLGWHYYYRWAYTDSVRRTHGQLERHGLFPLEKERERDDTQAPKELSLVRRLFGYTGDNDGSKGVGDADHAQLMGRVFVNSGLEVLGEGDSPELRFLKPTFLKELGMPRPSAVEHYLKQPNHLQSRPSDRATLVTFGDAAGYDKPGELAGRKFYLDRSDAVAEDDSDTNRKNERSTLALEASKPGRRFRFTVRFRDLEPPELAAVIIALCPEQFKAAIGGKHKEGYCSKLGYARPLGWGSVHIEAKQLLLLDQASEAPSLTPVDDLAGWVTKNHERTSTQEDWLAIHRRNHPAAADYPRPAHADRNGNRHIYTFHTTLRAEHSRNRRYKNGR